MTHWASAGRDPGAFANWLRTINANVRHRGATGYAPVRDSENLRLDTVDGLEIDNRSINELPDVLDTHLPSLTSLSVAGNRLERLPTSTYRLTQLRELYLGRNQLTELDDHLGDLKALEVLVASRNRLRSLPESIDQLHRLEVLNVRNNDLTALPSLNHLGRLSEIDVSENNLQTLPDLTSLMSLRNLYVSGNVLTDVPKSLSQCRSLVSLALSSNRIARLPDSIAALPALETLWIYDNPLESPPMAVALAGLTAIRKYWAAVAAGSQDVAPIVRVMVVGPPNTGKTSLVERLRHDRFLAEERHETLGVEIHEWMYEAASDTRVRLWDFGGQRYMHAAHRLFLDEGGVFVLVLDATSTEEAEYWVQLIATSASASAVIVALNKSDEAYAHLDSGFLAAKYPLITEFVVTSCLTGRGVDNLQRHIAEAVTDTRTSLTRVPITWAMLVDELPKSATPVLTTEAFRNTCVRVGVDDPAEQDAVLRFVAASGDVVLLNRLPNTPIALSPSWLVRVIYAVITSEIARDNMGLIREETAVRLASIEGGPELAHTLVDIMVAYDFCMRAGGDTLLVPDLLPLEATADIDVPQTGLVLHYIEVSGDSAFFFARCVPRFADDVVLTHISRYFVHLASASLQASATLQLDRYDRRIVIRCWGPDRVDYLGYLRATIKRTARAFGDIAVKDLIVVAGSKSTLDYEDVLGQYLMGETELCLGREGRRLSIPDILFGVDGLQGRAPMTNGPIYNFDRSSVTFGPGSATTTNSGDMRTVAAQLVEQLRRSPDAEGAAELADDIAEAAIANDRSKLRALSQKALVIGQKVAPIAVLANALHQLTGHA